MISLCLKSQFKETIDKLDSIISAIEFPNIIYCKKHFSKFYNLIIHYTGINKDAFYSTISDVLCEYIISTHEERIINTQLRLDFFYFCSSEQLEIKMLIQQQLSNTRAQTMLILNNSLNSYLRENHSANIEGLINFRIKKYQAFINTVIEEQINTYVIDKEYNEYVNLLSDYISCQSPKTSKIHLIYTENEKTLFDGKGNVLTTTSNKKYLSDISFSDNDFILNSILSFLPSKIVIHPQKSNDKFVTFLQSIFKSNCTICTSCNLCSKSIYNKSATE